MLIYRILVRILTSRPYKIVGKSMLPALADGQYVLLTQPSSSHPLQRGDLVVHRHPMGLNGIYVKRIVGLPNEHVRYETGHIFLNDVRLEETLPTGVTDRADPPIKEWWNGPGEYVVMGDNRPESHDDSRAFGAVPAASIIGRVWFRFWPPGSWGTL